MPVIDMERTVVADPLLAFIGLPSTELIPPTPPEDISYSKSIIVDLCHTTYADSQLSLLWLLFLSREGSRYLIAYIDSETDPDIVQLLGQFYQLTARCFCIKGFSLEQLITKSLPEDCCWVSSPSVIGHALLKRPIPLICLSCRDQKPIKGSWLDQYSPGEFFEHLRLTLQCIDPNAASKLARPESIESIHIQLLTCTYRAKDFLPSFLAHSAEWISTTAVHGLEVLHTFLDMEPELATRHQLLATLSQRKGFFLELKQDPGLYGAWNTLIQFSEEEFISNANPDDCRSSEQLRHLVAMLQAHPERMVASSVVVPIKQKDYLSWSFNRITIRCRQRWFSDVDDGYGIKSLYREPSVPGGAIEPHNIPHCSPVWRRTIHAYHGLFDEERYGSEADWGLWCKYAYHGGLFCHCDEPLSGYFINETSYGRNQQSSIGFERIVSDFLRSTEPVYSLESTSRRDLYIHGLDSYYGDHRVSNNSILRSLVDLHSNQAELKFIWFVEGYFIWGEASGERRSDNFQAIQQPWLGVMHIPPLTPKWAGNQFAELFFLKEWKDSLKQCRALICLSGYMAEDIKLVYPQLPVFNIKHPITPFSDKFELETFLSDPKVVLVGYWLRRHLRFYQWQAPLQKIHLIKKYTQDHMSWEMKAYGSLQPEEEASVIKYNFLPPDDYDQLLRTSLVYLSLYETSGNNSVIECISMGTPFIADRHPAIEEYVGVDYPLLLEPGELERMTRDELIDRASEAHLYLVSHPSLAEDLSYENFKKNLCGIIKTL